MRPSVQCGRNGALALRDFPVTVAVDVDTIDFYVPHKATENKQVFLVLKDIETGLLEVLELVYTMDEYEKPVYRLPLSYTMRLNNAQCDMSLYIYDVDSSTGIHSNTARVVLKTEHYKLAREIAVCGELAADAKRYYEAIVQVLQEVIMKGENNE